MALADPVGSETRPTGLSVVTTGFEKSECRCKAEPLARRLERWRPGFMDIIEGNLWMSDAGVLDRLPGAISKAENLPSPPTVAVEVLRLTKDENADVDELTTVLALDPALSAKVLKLANSSTFRRGEAATSLDKATMRLGSLPRAQTAASAAVVTVIG